jgi:hypothetical protein
MTYTIRHGVNARTLKEAARRMRGLEELGAAT